MWDREVEAFDHFKGGNRDELGVISDLLSRQTHDYVLRMTGDVKSSKIFSSDLDSLIAEHAESADDFFELRKEIFRKARLLHFDIWNMETPHLENEGFGFKEEPDRTRDLLMSLDKALQTLPGSQREALLLRRYYSFEDRDASDVMNTSAETIAQLCNEAEDRLRARVNLDDDFTENLAALPLHPLPEISDYSSIALSQIIENVQRSQPKRWPDQRRVLAFGLLVLVLLVLAYFFLPE
ncbi:MAG: RNA polymerase sigma factor [Oligoflexales bacterium]